MRPILLVLAVLAGCLLNAGSASAGAPVVSCAQLAGADFSGVPDAPSHIDSADMVSKGALTFCEVKGYIAPQTHFAIELPAHWQGQYLQQGCGGLCGRIPGEVLGGTAQASSGCAPVTNGELVLAGDDEGHASSDDADGLWGAHSPELRRVFGITSEHSMANLSKAVTTRYYGHGPSYSYYDGCSDGGREALMMAQRYPADFAGIIAGAPGSNMAPLLGIYEPWLARSNTDAQGHQILGTKKLSVLHRAVLAACANSKGIITDPRACAFDPASLRCRAVAHANCLTQQQISAARKLYRGPTDTKGRSLFNGGEPYGSELGWQNWATGPVDYSARIGLNFLKYLAYQRNPAPGFTLADVRFTAAEFARLDVLGRAIYNANNPDLSAFRSRGGKLLMYQGWADQAISPWSSLDYYAAVEKTAGGFAASQQFSRLYMVPGAYHCLIGPDTWGPTEQVRADFLTPLISWVQHNTPPAEIPAPIVRLSDDHQLLNQTVRPYNALTPVHPAPGSLNADYHYIGTYP